MGLKATYIDTCDKRGCNRSQQQTRKFGPGDSAPVAVLLPGWIDRKGLVYCPEHAAEILAAEADGEQ